MQELVFQIPDLDRMVEQIKALPLVGRALRTSRNLACVLCGGSILPLGRLAWPGAPLCRRPECEMTSLTHITALFRSPYGRTIDQGILRIFSNALEKKRILFQRGPIIERATELAQGHIELIRWQKAYHDYDRLTNPVAYQQGRVSLIPPRSLDEVLVFRAIEHPSPVDPTLGLKDDEARLIKRVKEEGPRALAVPF